jgi:hypothetical protein
VLEQIPSEGFSLKLGVFEVNGVLEFRTLEIERLIKFSIFEISVALEDRVFKAHTVRELSVLENGRILKFHVAEIGLSGKLCVFEVRIIEKSGIGEADIRRKFRVLEKCFFMVSRIREIGSLVKFGIFESGLSLKLTPLEADIVMENSVVGFVLPFIVKIGDNITLESAVDEVQRAADMVPESVRAVTGAAVVFVCFFVLDHSQIQVPDDFCTPVADGFALIDTFQDVFRIDTGLSHN